MSLALLVTMTFARYHADVVRVPGAISFVTDKVAASPDGNWRFDRKGNKLAAQDAVALAEPFLRKTGSPFLPHLLQAHYKIENVPFAHPPRVRVGMGDVKAGVLDPIDGARLVALFRENGQAVSASRFLRNMPVAWLGKENRLVALAIPSPGEGALSQEFIVSSTDGNQVVGSMQMQESPHRIVAISWNIDRGTYVILHPAGATVSSALAVDRGTIGGYVDDQAALWRGNVLTLLRRNAMVLDVRGEVQVGVTKRPGTALGDRAALWRGTPESHLDLHSYLPRDFKTSVATHIGEDGTIYGWGRNLQSRLVGLEWKLNPVRAALQK